MTTALNQYDFLLLSKCRQSVMIMKLQLFKFSYQLKDKHDLENSFLSHMPVNRNLNKKTKSDSDNFVLLPV